VFIRLYIYNVPRLDKSAVAAVAASQVTEKPRVGLIEPEGLMSSVRRV